MQKNKVGVNLHVCVFSFHTSVSSEYNEDVCYMVCRVFALGL